MALIPKKKLRAKGPLAEAILPAHSGGLHFRPGARIMGPNHTGVQIDEQRALCLSAVWACVRVVATGLAKIPLELVQRMPDGSYRQAVEHSAYPLFRHSPDLGNTTPMRLVQASMGHVLTYGNAYLGVDRYNDGEIALRLLDPRLVEVLYAPDKTIVYRVAGVDQPLDRSRIVHFAGLGFDSVVGYSPVSLVRQSIALTLVSENYASSFMANGNKSSGMLKSAAKMEEAAVGQMLDSFVEMTAGDNTGGVGYLPPGVDFLKLTVDPTDSQLLESRRFQVREIARIFGCPLNLIAEIEGYSYAGMEAESWLFINSTLQPWAICFEQSLNLRLLTRDEIRKGYEFKFDFSSLLRADTAARTAFYSGLKSCGAITSNEIRLREGLPKVADPDADKLYQPLNMAPIGDATSGDPTV
jgi:HK97 family phage portal protein